jgi:uncharacterized protein
VAGTLVHFELPADDAERAKQFWSDLFGWSFREGTGPVEYHMVDEDVEPTGAIYPSQAGEKDAIIYFDTDDIDGSVERVNELGGSAEDRQPIPGIGWYARCEDTEGNTFSLFQADESVQDSAGLQRHESST